MVTFGLAELQDMANHGTLPLARSLRVSFAALKVQFASSIGACASTRSFVAFGLPLKQ